MQSIPQLHSSHNSKSVPFDLLQPFPHPLTPISGNELLVLSFYEFAAFCCLGFFFFFGFVFRFCTPTRSHSNMSDLFHLHTIPSGPSVLHKWQDPCRRKWHPLQSSCLEKPMDRGTSWATVHGLTVVGHGLVTKPPPPPSFYG